MAGSGPPAAAGYACDRPPACPRRPRLERTPLGGAKDSASGRVRGFLPARERAGLDELRTRSPQGVGLRELWRHHELLRSLVARDLKVKFQRSLLGFVWTLLNPLLTSAVLAAVFSHVVRIQVPHYWAFLLSGYFVWNFMQQALNSSTYVLSEHARLSRSVAFPSEVLVLSSAMSRLIEFAIELALLVVLLVLLHHRAVPASLTLLPVLVLLQLLMAVGLMLPLALLSALYYDVRHALPIVLFTLFYLSPVFYPLDMVPETLRPVFLFNPLAHLFPLFQAVLYEARFPGFGSLALTAAIAVATLLVGYGVFNRYKKVCVEIA